jgi:phospholipid/cholesterol/gamma-HCH transport system ATP-binding protein
VTSDISQNRFAIEFRHVSLRFDAKLALDDVSFLLQYGQMICITGMSGSGKSVLLRLAAGLLMPDGGQVLIEGREIEGLSEQELLLLRGSSMGVVFQEQSLFTGMTVYENAAYRLDEHGWPEAETERAVREVLAFVGLEQDSEKLPEELSIGMRRRLEFARALVGWPKIMLFDEATAGLDPINARAMLDLVIRARDLHRISSLYVTKEMHEIPYLAEHQAALDEPGRTSISRRNVELDDDTKLLLLDAGRIGFFGSVAEFERSTLPAVTRMTRLEPGAPVASSYVADPWKNTRCKPPV